MEYSTVVLIVGAGPSGLATSACLNIHNIGNIVLEREDCFGSLWKKRSYDRIKLHLAKEFCELPHMPHPKNSPTFLYREEFIKYLDDYVWHFNLTPRCCRSVESATYDESIGKWHVVARNTESNKVEEYTSVFLVIATGENSEGVIPDIPGLNGFTGEILHSSEYKSGSKYNGKNVLVVGAGNSGMEIAFDLYNHEAKTSIVVRSPVHVLSKELVYLGMRLLKHVRVNVVDTIVLWLSKLFYGNLEKYGLLRPNKGPFFLKVATGRSPVIDVGTINKIESGDIQVLPALTGITGREASFDNGELYQFDAIIFATGYRSTATKWLKGYDYLLNQEGMPKTSFPNHWKGKNGLYCAGFSQRGLAGVNMDAKKIADDIHMAYMAKNGVYDASFRDTKNIHTVYTVNDGFPRNGLADGSRNEKKIAVEEITNGLYS